MDAINKLIKIFTAFPGIGPKQARRFVYYLLSKPDAYIKEIIGNLSELKEEINECNDCLRFFQTQNKLNKKCHICTDESRDSSRLLIVSRDIDFENIERSGAYNGKYFILGGTIPILDKEPEKKVRLKELSSLLLKNGEKIKEIILGLDANTDGEYTSDYIKKYITNLSDKFDFKISTFGRGLSTGTELEYSDADTIKNALKNRS